MLEYSKGKLLISTTANWLISTEESRWHRKSFAIEHQLLLLALRLRAFQALIVKTLCILCDKFYVFHVGMSNFCNHLVQIHANKFKQKLDPCLDALLIQGRCLDSVQRE